MQWNQFCKHVNLLYHSVQLSQVLSAVCWPKWNKFLQQFQVHSLLNSSIVLIPDITLHVVEKTQPTPFTKFLWKLMPTCFQIRSALDLSKIAFSEFTSYTLIAHIREHSMWRGRITVQLVSSLTRMDSTASLHANKNIYSIYCFGQIHLLSPILFDFYWVTNAYWASLQKPAGVYPTDTLSTATWRTTGGQRLWLNW